MTTMDTDSESQDSDDGRRFRFEATRKDANAAQLEARNNVVKSSNYESQQEEQERKDRKERSRHEIARKEYRGSKERETNSKECRHSTRHSKYAHDSRSLRQNEDGGKEQRDSRDGGFVSKNPDALTSKQKSRDLKRHRDRGEHRKHRSQERTYERGSDEKHKNKSYEKHRHHSHERSRERSYQSEKTKSSASESGRVRGEHERYNSHKRGFTKENDQHSRGEYSPAKNLREDQNEGEAPSRLSQETSRREQSIGVDSQDCRELDLSDFDILSETDEYLSDVSTDGRSRSSLPRYRKTKVKKRDSRERHESVAKKQATKNERHSEERQKVNARKNDTFSGSSDSNPSAISDLLLAGVSSRTSAIKDDRAYDDGKRFKSNFTNERNADLASRENYLNAVEETPSHFNSQSSSRVTYEPEGGPVSSNLASVTEETDNDTYGPALPANLSSTSDETGAESKAFIGPCLPLSKENKLTETFDRESSDKLNPDADRQNSEEEDFDADITFGPALPPHLLQQRTEAETRSKVIGPVLPSAMMSSPNNVEEVTKEKPSDSEDDDAIGPLPIDHPALKNNYVHEQLEQRAQRIKGEQKDKGNSILTQREEWMTELPPAQASNLGLGPRKFRLREGPDMSDRSCWTDTPATRAEKQKKREEEKLFAYKPSDAKLTKESCVDSGKGRKREKSLLELHQSKLQKKKKKEEKEAKLAGHTTRRPFDRDIDLKANQFDQAQKKTIFMKAQLLDDRFSRGEI